MMQRFASPRRWSALLLAGALGLIQGCGGGGGDDNGGTSPTPSITIALSPTSASVQQGGSTTVTATVTGAGGFTGVPVLSVSGAPTGVTGGVSNIQTSGSTTTATVTISVAATTATGTYPLTVNASGSGVSAVAANFSLVVTAATASGNYTLSASPASLTLTQGGAAVTSTINVNRTGGFAGSVALAVTGAPSGVTASLNPTSTTGNSSVLTVTAAAGAALGNATLTIAGTSAGLSNQTTTVALTVSASGGSGNVVVDFSACAAANKPIWLAFQNGTTGWTQVTNVGDVYRFNITQSKGGIAYTTQSASGGTTVSVQYLTQAELTSGTLTFCSQLGGKTLTGSVAGLGTGDAASISMGGAFAVAQTNAAYTLTGVATGNQDLVAYRSNFISPGTSDKAIIRRDQNIAAGGAIPVLDFGAAEAFNPATATATVSGAGSDQIIASMAYYVGACVASTLSTNPLASASFTMRGIPAAQQRTNDYHQLSVTAANGTTSFRNVIESFHTMADKTFTLGAALPTPTVTIQPAAYKRLQAVVTLPADYQSSMTLTYVAATKGIAVTATFGWLGGASATLAFPDFAGVAGWQDAWAPATGTTVTWTVAGTGTNITSTGTICAEGSRIKSGFVTGSI